MVRHRHRTGRLRPGGVSLVNLFSARAGPGAPLTLALLALLEHSDRSVLEGFLALAGLSPPEGAEASFHYPAPDGPPGAGEIRLGDRRIRVAAVAPGEPPPEFPPGTAEGLLVGGPAPAGPGGLPGAEEGEPVRRLSWERLDRWLEEAAAVHDPDTRTGFLIRQFRAYLPEAGITWFRGFDAEELDRAPRAFRELSAFHRRVGELFEQVGSGFAASWPLLRTARPEDLLAGYWFRDYAVGSGGGDFLRVALDLGAGELQIALWFEPGGGAHGRLQLALAEEGGLSRALARLTPPPVLRLWSAADERHIPVGDLDPSRIHAVDWEAYTAAVQVARPLTDLAGEGLLDRLAGWTRALLDALAPVLSEVVH